MNNSSNIYFNFLEIIWENKFKIISSSLVGAFLSISLSFTQPVVYESQAILKAIDSNEESTSNIGSLGGFSSFVGVDFASEEAKRLNYAMAVLKSRDFFDLFYPDQNFLVYLFAMNGYKDNFNLSIDNNVYDLENKKWAKKFRNNQNFPGFEESYERFHSKLLSVQLDKKTNYIHLKTLTTNPAISKLILEDIIYNLNNFVREIELLESKSSMDYLEEYLSQKNPTVEVRESVTSLLEKEIKTQMYANIKDDYMLEQIEKPRIIIEKTNPKRSIWAIFGFAFGLIMSFVMIIYGKIISKRST